jgi:hypothetical protein
MKTSMSDSALSEGFPHSISRASLAVIRVLSRAALAIICVHAIKFYRCARRTITHVGEQLDYL